MNPSRINDAFVHRLVSGSHAQGVNRLAVAALIEDDERILLIETPGHDFIDTTWDLPTGLVLPGETLLDSLHRIVTTTTSVQLDEVTGCIGHDDHITADEPVRVFIFTATTIDPHRICRAATVGHQWTTSGHAIPDSGPVIQGLLNRGW